MILTEEKTFNDASELIDFLTKLAKNKGNVFRGYGKQSELFPNIIRDKDLSQKEIEFLHRFERYGLQFFSTNNAIDFMSYGQHYGLPTRLLDFTYNPFVALYFALFMPKSSNYSNPDDSKYYYIRYCNIKNQILIKNLPYFNERIFESHSFAEQCNKMIVLLKRIISGLDEEIDKEHNNAKIIAKYFETIYSQDHPEQNRINITEFKRYMQDFMDKLDAQRILFIDAHQCSQRIVMQQGLFMFPYNLDRHEHENIIIQNTNLIKISKTIRNELSDYLNTIGVNAFKLMPDLVGVCDAIKRQVMEEK